MASCGDQQTGTGENLAAPEEETQQQDKSAVVVRSDRGVTQMRKRTEDIELHEERESQLSTITFDGTSEAAFEGSLQQFQEVAPTAEYQNLKSAIKYLEVL